MHGFDTPTELAMGGEQRAEAARRRIGRGSTGLDPQLIALWPVHRRRKSTHAVTDALVDAAHDRD